MVACSSFLVAVDHDYAYVFCCLIGRRVPDTENGMVDDEIVGAGVQPFVKMKLLGGNLASHEKPNAFEKLDESSPADNIH